MDRNSTKQLTMKITALRVIGQQKVQMSFLAFFVELLRKAKISRRHTIIPHRQPKI
jgi:hypothetical protein